MLRRDFIATLAASALPLAAPSAASAQEFPAMDPPTSGAPGSFANVAALARALSEEPFAEPPNSMVGPFDGLGYDAYRAIRADVRPLGAERDGFAIDMLPPGLVYDRPVTITMVDGGTTRDVPFDMAAFSFGERYFDPAANLSRSPAPAEAGYSGFRLRYPINRVDVSDEFVVFQGASYFRAVARDLLYGLSARGLAIATGDRRGEEFPLFRQFWIETPKPGARSVTVRALLDSVSCAGAFEFDIEPGVSTVIQTRCRLFPRTEISQIGIAPLTSMYFFGPERRAGVDDFRNAVHDSEGLQIVTGEGLRLWRPLTNPRQPQISAFQDRNPKGFGLTQRRRDFDYYQDDEARYEKRPSAWVEPLEAWGDGAVILVEIPVNDEFNDNIVAFWRPAAPLGPTDEGHDFSYRLHWSAEPPDAAPFGRVIATRTGRSIHNRERRVIAVDFLKQSVWPGEVEAETWISRGEMFGVTCRKLPGGDVMRASFEFAPGDAELVEFQMRLVGEQRPLSETWLYRWTTT